MSVTFNTPVVVDFATTTSLTFSMTGVTSGEPIIITALCTASEFANTATVSGMGYTATLVQYAAANESFAQWILTGGSGTSGTITVSGLPSAYWGGVAVSCVGASLSSGLAAIESYGYSGAGSPPVTSITWAGLTINAVNSGALYFAVISAVTGGINGFPSGFTSTVVPGTYNYGDVATLSAPGVGALSASWTSSAAAGWAFGGLTILAATPEYQVTFNANGGTGSMSPEVASSPTALTTNSFTYTNFVFTGWNTQANGSGTAYANGATYPFATSVTLYAQWAPANPVVTFNANGGSGSMSPQTEPYDTVAPLTANAFTLTGYTFIGWNTALDGTGTAYANEQSFTFVANVTLYAQWVIDQFVLANTSVASGIVWQAPTPGQATLVGHVNQLLTSHASLFAYDGATIGTDPTLTGSATALGDTLLAQAVTIANPVNLGTVLLALGALGAGQDALVTLQADSAGAPSGTPLVGCLVPAEWLTAGVASGASLFAVPLPYALAAGTYHVVVQPGSNLLGGFSQALAGVNDVQWTQTTGSGAQVYTGGAWVTESYGFGVYLRDYTGAQLRAIADDAITGLAFPCPAKVTSFAYSSGRLANFFEWVARSLNVTSNQLCRDDASFEVSLGSAAAVANATVARSDAQALDGLFSLQMTATALGTMSARVGPYPVTAGDIYSWTAAFLAGGASLEVAYAAVEWYDGATYLSTSDGTLVTTSETSWQASEGTATAPATATLAYVEFVIENAPASSVFYVDGVGLFAGPSAVWSYPGVGVANALNATYALNSLTEAT